MTRADGSGFQDVDHTPDPMARVSYLDAVSALAGARAYKQQSFELMRLEPGGAALDVGCGTGTDLRSLAALVGPSGRVVGVDISETMIAQARASTKGLPVECYVGGAHGLDFESGTFDASRADRVFMHLERPRDAFAELVRVTRPGGRVVVSEPDWDTLVVDASDKVVTRAIRQCICDNNRNGGWLGRQLAAMAGQCGLSDVLVDGYTVVFRNWSQAREVLPLDSALESAVAKGLVAAAAAAAWLADQEQRAAAGYFFSAGTGFIVSGRKPA
jgi:ubiquinone/menaquinone biosynthesis C-methylase UbiE